jgi:hypothetical protein
MEPCRFLIDDYTVSNQSVNFGKEDKREIINLLNKKVRIDKTQQFLMNAIGIYAKSVFDAITENDENKIKFLEHEL